MVVCLEQSADDLHMLQLMPLPPHHLLLHLWPPYVIGQAIYIFILWFLSFFFFLA